MFFFLYSIHAILFSVLQAFASQTFTFFGSSAVPGQQIDEKTTIKIAPNKPVILLVHGFDPLGLGASSWFAGMREAIHKKVYQNMHI